MTRKAIVGSLLLLVVAACGTPQEQCINRETRDLRILDRLIGESEGNLNRGYALEQVEYTRTRWVVCAPAVAATDTSPAQPAQMCERDYDYTVTEPRSINLADERVKLAEMHKKRRDLARGAERAIAQCKLAHPD